MHRSFDKTRVCTLGTADKQHPHQSVRNSHNNAYALAPFEMHTIHSCFRSDTPQSYWEEPDSGRTGLDWCSPGGAEYIRDILSAARTHNSSNAGIGSTDCKSANGKNICAVATIQSGWESQRCVPPSALESQHDINLPSLFSLRA